jgi:hypothetical protein
MTTAFTPPQRVLGWGALAFLASGLFHVVVWWIDGIPPLEGPVSWRKPIVFGLSTGVLSLSLMWIIGLLPQTVRLYRQSVGYTGLIAAELLLIAMQQWRGVGSHFNNATAFDGAVFTAMGVIIMAAAVILALWTRAIFRPLAAPHHFVLSARAGMLLLNAGNLMGVFIAAWGGAQVAQGLTPNIYGAAGQLKIPHAVALHAVQVLPVIAWLLHRASASKRAMRLAVSGYVGLFSFALVQTFSGRAPLDLTIATTLLAVASLALMGWPIVAATLSRRAARSAMLPTWDVVR